MPLEGSYAIWNNRGGTGKTTLTYHLANKYAIKHPDKTILAIDMCPQADLSHAFLGDDDNHMDYVSQLGTMKKEPMSVGDQKFPKTVSGYLDLVTSTTTPSVDPRTFLTNVSKYNSQLPRNLYLLCGDASLELVARSLEQKRNQQASLSQYGPHAWKHVTQALKQFVKKIAERKGIKLVVFIDVNSSFSIITEIALAASDKLLIPISDEHMHRNGFEYMFALLYGFSQPSNVYYYYRHFSFYYRANEHDVKLPRIHLILNKLTKSPSQSLATNNNNANAELTDSSQQEWEFIFDLFKKHAQAFSLNPNRRSTPPQTLQEFKDAFVIDICEQASTNHMVRQAVRSHSPLLSIKNASHSNSIVSSISAHSRNASPNATQSHQQQPDDYQSSSSPSISKSTPYPYQLQTHISRLNKNLMITTNNRNDLLNTANANVQNPTLLVNASQGEQDVEYTNAIFFDKILDKIVDNLHVD